MSPHHRHSIRLQKLDYSLSNKFFVTICAFQHGCYFDKYPILPDIINQNISYISKHFPNISLDKYIIMPNHFHAIISINYQIKSVTLGAVIKVLKSKIINDWLKFIKQNQLSERACFFQRNYHERCLRNLDELLKYSKYIDQNPTNWNKDRYNPRNLPNFPR